MSARHLRAVAPSKAMASRFVRPDVTESLRPAREYSERASRRMLVSIPAIVVGSSLAGLLFTVAVQVVVIVVGFALFLAYLVVVAVRHNRLLNDCSAQHREAFARWLDEHYPMNPR